MATRLGQVIYWIGCGVAAISAAMVAFVLLAGNQNYINGVVLFSIVGGLSWLVGRASLYVLAGK